MKKPSEIEKQNYFWELGLLNTMGGTSFGLKGKVKTETFIEKWTNSKNESTNVTNLKHLNGTISMARNEPGTASTEIFICINDQPELDYNGSQNPEGFGFSAFGLVKSEMDIVKTIQ